MNSFQNYPYPIHTNRELELMLAGEKPFAVFAHEGAEGFEKADALADQDFQVHVQNGRFTEHLRTYTCDLPRGGQIDIDHWFYAVPGEEWRVEAYCLLWETQRYCGWCAQLEWQQGKLLGYSDEQNRYHLSRMYPDQPVSEK